MGDCLIMHRKHDWAPEFTYTGQYELVGDNGLNSQWKIRFLSSGVLTFIQPNSASRGIDVFLVGGGGGGACTYTPQGKWGAAAGGGSGYTKTVKNVQIERREAYQITIGQGGNGATNNTWSVANANGGAGSASSAFGETAAGGAGGAASHNYSGSTAMATGGSGGSGGFAHKMYYGSSGTGAVGGTDGANGGSTGVGGGGGGTGQGTTTHEFGESGGDLYATGGGTGTPQTANSGNGGNGVYNGGFQTTGGCSGIVVIRLHRIGDEQDE